MFFETTVSSLDAYFAWMEKIGFFAKETEGGISYIASGQTGRGRLDHYIYPGRFEIVTGEICLARPLTLRCRFEQTFLEFSKVDIEQPAVSVYRGAAEQNHCLKSFFYSGAQPESNYDVPPNMRIKLTSIIFLGEFIDSILEQKDLGGRAKFQAFVKQSESRASICELCPMVSSIQNLHFDGAAKLLFLESKALELLSVYFGRYQAYLGSARQSMQQEEMAVFDKILDVLHQDIRRCPNLEELTRMAALNSFKLKKGFKAYTGQSIYAYHLHLKMQKAWELLNEGKQSIGEVSRSLGYKSQGKFSLIFKKHHGVLPKELKK